MRTVVGRLINIETIDDAEDVMFGGSFPEAECPECGDVRDMEEDADYFICNCGVKVKFKSFHDLLYGGELE